MTIHNYNIPRIIILFGALSNVIVIGANGWKMPVLTPVLSKKERRKYGDNKHKYYRKVNNRFIRFKWLCDCITIIFPRRKGYYVLCLSVGDILLISGLLSLIIIN